jgi:hypothetical protein
VNPETFGDALSWMGDHTLVDRLDDAFSATTETALVGRAGPAVVEAVQRLDTPGRRRLLRAPEVTRRLLFQPLGPELIDAFIARAAAVESTLAGAGTAPSVATWSALGDVVVEPDGSARWWPQLRPAMETALDFGSPWARRVDLSGRQECTDGWRPVFTDVEVRSVHARLVGAIRALDAVSPTIRPFLARSTCVLVLQIDPAARAVASGTNGHYIGRSFITNPHCAEATSECLVEGVVHEAIHGLLFRESIRRPWVTGDAAVEVPRVRSPWTGRALPVRSFLEAAYVWFGLVHLWALAGRAAAFDADIVRERLLRGVRGFGRGSLADHVQTWSAEIRPDVLETVVALQERVVDALAGAA